MPAAVVKQARKVAGSKYSDEHLRSCAIMKPYEMIEHTADTGLIACGETLAGAFENSALGMFSVIVDPSTVRETETRRVEIHEDDAEGMLFEWLNGLLYYFDAEMLLFGRFDIVEFDEKHLTADCFGERYDPSRHELKTGVKAATYHLLEVDREKKRVRVIFDI